MRLFGEAECRKCGLAAMGLCRTGGAGFEMDAACPTPVKIGEKVKVLRGGRHPGDGGFTMFGIPVAALVLGAVAGHVLGAGMGWEPDLAGAVLGFSGLVLTLFPALWLHYRWNRRGRFMPRVERMVRNSRDVSS